jgi:hypothetical protein
MAETAKIDKMEKDWSAEVSAGLLKTTELAQVSPF